MMRRLSLAFLCAFFATTPLWADPSLKEAVEGIRRGASVLVDDAAKTLYYQMASNRIQGVSERDLSPEEVAKDLVRSDSEKAEWNFVSVPVAIQSREDGGWKCSRVQSLVVSRNSVLDPQNLFGRNRFVKKIVRALWTPQREAFLLEDYVCTRVD